MSVKASTWAWEIEGLDIYQKMVLLRLADHANTEGFCYPGKDSLVAACCCSQRKVDQVVKELEQLGLITVEQRSKGGRMLTNVYHLRLDQLTLFSPGEIPQEAANPAHGAPRTVCPPRTPEQLTPHTALINPAQCAPESRSNRKEPSVLSSPAGEEQKPEPTYESKKGKKLTGSVLDRFLGFWNAFGHKEGKSEAADAWLEQVEPRLMRGTVSLEHIVGAAAAEAVKRDHLRQKGQTPKMAQGWLAGRRWEDYETVPAHKPKPAEPLPWFRTIDGIHDTAYRYNLVPVLYPNHVEMIDVLMAAMKAAGDEVPQGLLDYQQVLRDSSRRVA